MTEEIIYTNDKYIVTVMEDRTGYKVTNKQTGVCEGEVPVLPQAVAMAQGWSESIDGLLRNNSKDTETKEVPKLQ